MYWPNTSNHIGINPRISTISFGRILSQLESPPELYYLALPIEARYIRIQIEPINNENDDSVTVYVELYGCHVSADVASAGEMSLWTSLGT